MPVTFLSFVYRSSVHLSLFRPTPSRTTSNVQRGNPSVIFHSSLTLDRADVFKIPAAGPHARHGLILAPRRAPRDCLPYRSEGDDRIAQSRVQPPRVTRGVSEKRIFHARTCNRAAIKEKKRHPERERKGGGEQSSRAFAAHPSPLRERRKEPHCDSNFALSAIQ